MNLFDLCVYKNLNKESGGDVDVSSLVATENKTYNAGEGKAYNPVVVNVPTPSPSLQSLTASHNGYFVPSSGYEGFSEVTVDVATPLETLSATENGTYTPSSGYEGFSEVTVDVPLPNNAYLLESQKNDVVTIQHGAEFDMPKLIASIEPQQDLHGYDSPWVGGAGKNKLPMTVDGIKNANSPSSSWSGKARLLNGVTFTILTDESENVIGIKAHGQATETTSLYISKTLSLPNGSYILNGCPSGGGLQAYGVFADYSSGGNIPSYGEDATLLINNVTLDIRIRIASGYNCNNLVFTPMIRLSSVTDSTFAPYSNECPISGWTACNVVRTGKNLVDAIYRGYYNTQNGSIVNQGIRVRTEIKKWKAGTYTVGGSTSVIGKTFQVVILQWVNGSNGSNTCTYDSGWNNAPQTITLTQDTYMSFVFRHSDNSDISVDDVTVQVEIGNQATAYESYSGNTYTINFVDGSSPLTVYGGTLDVINGTSGNKKTLGFVDLGTLSWSTQENPNTFQAVVSDMLTPSNNIMCSHYPTISASTSAANMPDKSIKTYGNSSAKYIIVKDSSYSDVTAFKTAMDGVQLVYELETPITFESTPTPVKSLRGVNSIYADTGEVDVQIWTKEVTS